MSARAGTSARHAVYFAPAVDSPWWRFGAGWLGWDEMRGTARCQPPPPEFSQEDFRLLTSEPRRYGFHATLKAPFRLRDEAHEALLFERVDRLAAQMQASALGPLAPQQIGKFVALVPVACPPAVGAIASRCVLELDDLRAPLTAPELARRESEGLDAQGRELMRRYGYPHVLERFRFHLTLSGPVDRITADILIARANERIASLNANAPLELDRLCVFREDHPGAPFLRVHETALLPRAQQVTQAEVTQ